MSGIFNYMFNDLFDLAAGNFSYRPYKESEKYRFYKKEGKGYVLSVDARGVSEKDIKITLTAKEKTETGYPFISIKGSSKNEYSNENYTVNLSGHLLIKEEIEKLSYNCKDGVCVIFIKTKQPEKPEEIVVESTGKLEW